jgi:hypothetical protein
VKRTKFYWLVTITAIIVSLAAIGLSCGESQTATSTVDSKGDDSTAASTVVTTENIAELSADDLIVGAAQSRWKFSPKEYPLVDKAESLDGGTVKVKGKIYEISRSKFDCTILISVQDSRAVGERMKINPLVDKTESFLKKVDSLNLREGDTITVTGVFRIGGLSSINACTVAAEDISR